MNRHLLFSALLLFIGCGSEPMTETNPEPLEITLIQKLNMIEGIQVEAIPTEDHFKNIFKIEFLQPVDHNNPGGPMFSQKIFLSHVDETMPVVFETEGYERENHRTRELAPLLGANQLAVEHRFFGQSVPNPRDWQYLNIWQAANDHHRIVEAFKTIYQGSWISSGASKGGDCAIFHRRFFPDDVEATLAYVAPLLFEQQDKRFLDFYNTSGDQECREKMKQFQRNILMKIDSIPPLFDAYVKSVGDFGLATTFSLSYRDIVYHATREDYAFEFWSSEIEDCSTIPGENAKAQELLDHFVGVFDVFLFFSDFGVRFWTPYIYQAQTELGNYAHDLTHLMDLEMDIPPLSTFNTTTEFDPGAMQDIQNWLDNSASEMIFIYGSDDPWTVAAVNDPSSQTVLKIINQGTKHGTRIASLSQNDRLLVLQKLEEWMER